MRPQRRSALPAAAVGAACLALQLLFALLAWTSSTGESATADEPLHAAAAFSHRFLRDFRIDPANPPLFKYWAMLPHHRDSLRVDRSDPLWTIAPQMALYDDWVTKVLYRTAGNDGATFIQRSRAAMLVLGCALGGVTALWAWRLGGGVAALATSVLFCLDPNFLAHAPLVKNDVAFCLVVLATAYVIWLVGHRATAARIATLGLLCGLAVNVKLSGLTLAPIVFVLLLARALAPWPWPFLRRELACRRKRLGASAALCLVLGVTSWGATWATYDFRYAPTPDQSIRLDAREVLRMMARAQAFAHHPDVAATDAEIATWKPGPLVKAIQFAEDRRLLPQAWLHGLLYMRMALIARKTFLLDRYGATGWWYYFPLAMLFKTPLATLGAFGLAAAYVAGWARRRPAAPDGKWTALCLATPFAIYGIGALASRVDLGLRYVLPLYPFLFVVAAVGFARLLARRRTTGMIVASLLSAGLATESLLAYPHFIPFFNAPSAYAGPIRLLGDSNLDWGQDLPLLAAWQRRHPDQELALSYFGLASPRFYGLRYTSLPGTWDRDEPRSVPSDARVWAISATNLQGIYMSATLRAAYRLLLRERPLAVLGGSIYLFHVNPNDPAALALRSAFAGR